MTIEYNRQIYDIHQTYSLKNFTGWDMTAYTDMDGVIYASNFQHEVPDSKVFPDNLRATFIRCHLENCVIPSGCTVIDCFQTRFQVQNDLNDWEIDSHNNPVHPLDYNIFTKKGLPIPKPQDIPVQKVTTRIDLIKVAEDAILNP